MGLAADEFGVHAGVDAVLGEEAVVGAAFDDAAVVEDEVEKSVVLDHRDGKGWVIAYAL
jgi:hypothetical protein